MGFSEHQQRRFKVQKGRQIHRERSSSPLPSGLPPVVKRLKNPRLFANHGLYSGEPDEVLFFSDGSVSPLDYKFSPSSSSPAPSHRFQLLFYALLLSETFELPVHQGFLLFCRDEDVLLSVPLPSASFDDLFHAILQIHRIRQEGYFPPPTETPLLCSSCAFRKVCPFDPLDDSDLFASDAFSPSPPDHDL